MREMNIMLGRTIIGRTNHNWENYNHDYQMPKESLYTTISPTLEDSMNAFMQQISAYLSKDDERTAKLEEQATSLMPLVEIPERGAILANQMKILEKQIGEMTHLRESGKDFDQDLLENCLEMDGEDGIEEECEVEIVEEKGEPLEEEEDYMLQVLKDFYGEKVFGVKGVERREREEEAIKVEMDEEEETEGTTLDLMEFRENTLTNVNCNTMDVVEMSVQDTCEKSCDPFSPNICANSLFDLSYQYTCTNPLFGYLDGDLIEGEEEEDPSDEHDEEEELIVKGDEEECPLMDKSEKEEGDLEAPKEELESQMSISKPLNSLICDSIDIGVSIDFILPHVVSNPNVEIEKQFGIFELKREHKKEKLRSVNKLNLCKKGTWKWPNCHKRLLDVEAKRLKYNGKEDRYHWPFR